MNGKGLWLLNAFICLTSVYSFGHPITFKVIAPQCRQLFRAPPTLKEQVLSKNLSDIPVPSRSKSLEFRRNSETVAEINPTASVEQILLETSMYSATPEFAIEHGGPITREIIKKIPEWYYDKAKELGLFPNIDVRVHNLSRDALPADVDLFPAIPGWHTDGEFRETYSAQPDLNHVPISFHIIATVSTHRSGVSNTQFLNTPIAVYTSEHLPDFRLWQSVHSYVETIQNRSTDFMPDGAITMFDARSLHRAMPVKNNGWRLFFRMSMWHKPNLDEGQISLQEQLYLLPKPTAKPNPIVEFSPTISSKVRGRFKGFSEISELAKEQSLVGATFDFARMNGGGLTRELIKKVPEDFLKLSKAKGMIPVVDVIVFRLYPGYRPIFPDYSGKPIKSGWHQPFLSTKNEMEELPEIYMAISTSNAGGVNKTVFADGTILNDGEILEVSSHLPRKENNTVERGWRLLMRVSLRHPDEVHLGRKVDQQYVDPQSESYGW